MCDPYRMSWEYETYIAICADCGTKGKCTRGSDDWGRSSTRWEGFQSREQSANAVARKRADARDQIAVCECGGTNILIEGQPE
jgi:hypothetical protein